MEPGRSSRGSRPLRPPDRLIRADHPTRAAGPAPSPCPPPRPRHCPTCPLVPARTPSSPTLATVIIWLPPSEGKTAPTHGPALDWEGLSLPGLTSTRQAAARALARVSASSDAPAILGLGPKSALDAQTNLDLHSSPCAPADEVYSGVLFDAANFAGLTTSQREDAREVTWIFSGLFGAVRAGDLIPDHRLPMGTTLPDLGGLARMWKSPLDEHLRPLAQGRVVLDLRSGPYRAACPAPWARVVRLGVVRESAGRRTVISHDAKRWRGLVVGELARLSSLPIDEGDAVEAVATVAGAATVVDAKGGVHQVSSVEVSAATPTRQGGSVRDLTVVTT